LILSNLSTKVEKVLNYLKIARQINRLSIAIQNLLIKLINRGLSYFKDTALFANEMNLHADLPHRMQYDFYKHIVTPKRRFSKWGKKAKASEDITIIQKAYNYSKEKAEAVYPLISKSQMKSLYSLFDEGGKG
jgi:hypothetical protein